MLFALWFGVYMVCYVGFLQSTATCGHLLPTKGLNVGQSLLSRECLVGYAFQVQSGPVTAGHPR